MENNNVQREIYNKNMFISFQKKDMKFISQKTRNINVSLYINEIKLNRKIEMT